MSELTVTVTENPDVTIITLDGSAALEGAAELDRRLTPLIAQRPRYVVIDCAQLSFISSLTLGSLIGLAQSMSRNGGKMAIAAAMPSVAAAMKRCRLESVIPMHSTLEAALEV